MVRHGSTRRTTVSWTGGRALALGVVLCLLSCLFALAPFPLNVPSAAARVIDPGSPQPICSPPEDPAVRPCLQPNYLATASPSEILWSPTTLDNGVTIGGRTTLTWSGNGTPNWHCNQPGCLRVLDPGNLGSSTLLINLNHISSGSPAVASLGNCGTSTTCEIVLLTSPQMADWFYSFGPGPQYQLAIIPLNRLPSAATIQQNGRLGPYTYAFRASGGVDPDGDPVTYSWNFGDGGGGAGQDVVHTFPGPGLYDFSVTVSDPEGGSATSSWSEQHGLNLYGVGDPLVVTIESDPVAATGSTFDVRLRVYNQDFADNNSVLRVAPPSTVHLGGSVTQVGGPEPSMPTDLDAQDSIEYVYRFTANNPTVATFNASVTALDITGGLHLTHSAFEPASTEVRAASLLHVDDIIYNPRPSFGPLGYVFDAVVTLGDPTRTITAYEWRVADALHDQGYEPGIGSFLLGAVDVAGLYRVTLFVTDDDPDGPNTVSLTKFFFIGDGGLTPTLTLAPARAVTDAAATLHLNVRNDHSESVDNIVATVEVIERPDGATVTFGSAQPLAISPLSPGASTDQQRAITVDTPGRYRVRVTVVGTDTATNTGVAPGVAELIFDAESDALVVNTIGDQDDAVADDNICDVDPDEPANQCTLRAAIQTANGRASAAIRFDIPGAGPHVIGIHSDLPIVTSPVVVDGTTQRGYSGSPVVGIDGGDTTAFGLVLERDSAVLGLSVTRFRRGGIVLGSSLPFAERPGGGRVEKSWIGVTPGGESAGNGVGILVGNSHDNTIGGTGKENVISGNWLGVAISGSPLLSGATASATVGANLIGLSPDATHRLATTGPPAAIEPDNDSQSSGVLVHGRVSRATLDSLRISIGPTAAGVRVRAHANNAVPSQVRLTNSHIAGGAVGVLGEFAPPMEVVGNTLVGEGVAGGIIVNGRSTLSGNTIDGYQIQLVVAGEDAAGSSVSANHIGLSPTAAPSIAGIFLYATGSITVSGNDIGGAAMGIALANADGNDVRNNNVGAVTSGPANATGIAVIQSASNRIGPGNDVGGNTLAGIFLGADVPDSSIPALPPLDGRATNANRIFGNRIGIGFDVQAAGVVLRDASVTLTTIGGTTAEANEIAGNATGVAIIGAGAGNVIRNNNIIRAGVGGVMVQDTSQVTIRENTVSGGLGTAVGIGLSTVSQVAMRANAIGPNGGPGISVLPSDNGGVPIPVIAPGAALAAGVTVSVGGATGSIVEIEAFANAACDASGSGEGERFLGSATHTLSGAAADQVFVPFSSTQLVGTVITTTATIAGATSAFSVCGTVVAAGAVLTAPAPAGTRRLSVNSTSGFVPGQVIAVNAGTPTAEFVIYQAEGSLIVDRPLVFDHAIGETVAVAVSPGNLRPWCDGQTATTGEDTPLDGVTVCSDESPATMSYTVAPGGAPLHGTLLLGPSGTWRYTPAANYHGPDAFTILATDQHGLSGPSHSVSVDITAVNDPPLCAPLTMNLATLASAVASPACTDADGDVLSFSISTQGMLGSADVAAGQLRYTAGGTAGSDQFRYVASDATSSSTPATVTVTVNIAAPPTSGLTVTLTSAAIVPANKILPSTMAATGTLRPVTGATVACGETVTLTIGPLTETLPGASFRKVASLCVYVKPLRAKGFVTTFSYDIGRGQWVMTGLGAQPTFAALDASVNIRLTIGNDSGTTAATFVKHGPTWTFPR